MVSEGAPTEENLERIVAEIVSWYGEEVPRLGQETQEALTMLISQDGAAQDHPIPDQEP